MQSSAFTLLDLLSVLHGCSSMTLGGVSTELFIRIELSIADFTLNLFLLILLKLFISPYIVRLLCTF